MKEMGRTSLSVTLDPTIGGGGGGVAATICIMIVTGLEPNRNFSAQTITRVNSREKRESEVSRENDYIAFAKYYK